jgi:hypothetical protein
MKTISHRQIIIPTVVSVLLFFLFGFQTNRDNPDLNSIKKKVKKDLMYLDKYNGAWDTTDTDPESFGLKTANSLVKLLTFTELKDIDLKGFGNLTRTASTNDSFNIHLYNFYYITGGTMGSRDFSVIQWTSRNGKLFAYHLTKEQEMTYEKVYRLNSKTANLFLLLGSSQANSTQTFSSAKIIQIKGDYLILKYPAFVTESELLFANSELSFNPVTQTLTIQTTGEESFQYIKYKIKNPATKDTAAYKIIYNQITPKISSDGIVTLKFNGKKFLK